MRFGLLITNQHLPPEPSVERFAETIEQVRLARALGFDLILFGRHFLVNEFQMLQPAVAAARLAAEAGPMRLGITIYLLSLLNPVAVAEEVATLDILTGGRFIFGVGLGYREVEDQAFGLAKGERVGRLVRHLDVIRRVWGGGGGTVGLPHCRLAGAPAAPRRPARARAPAAPAPAGVGGGQQRPGRRARGGDRRCLDHQSPRDARDGCQADGALPGGARTRRETVPVGAADDEGDLRSGEPRGGGSAGASVSRAEVPGLRPVGPAPRPAGKPFPSELPMMREICVAESRAEAVQLARPYLEQKYRAYVQWGQHRALPRDDDMTQAFDDLLRDRFILGDPSECAAEIRRCIAATGATTMLFRVHWPGMPHETVTRAMRFLAEKVWPLVG